MEKEEKTLEAKFKKSFSYILADLPDCLIKQVVNIHFLCLPKMNPV